MAASSFRFAWTSYCQLARFFGRRRCAAAYGRLWVEWVVSGGLFWANGE